MVDVLGRAVIEVVGKLDPKSFQKTGQEAGGALSRSLSTTAKAAGAGIGIVLAGAIAKGFQRLNAIDEAQAKLRGLGNSAKTISTVMENALASVKGTAFGLGDAASVAASAVASGVKPGKELERTLKLVADASTIAGTDLSSMGAIFNKVASTGKAQGEVLQQLGERGVPIVSLLAKTMHKSAAEVVQLASDGKVGFAEFQAAIEAGMGGAAQQSGKTFSGALANAGAALGRFGAAFIAPAFAMGPTTFGKITEKLDALTPAADAAGKKIGAVLGPALGKVADFLKKKFDDLKPTFDRIGAAVDKLAPIVGKVAGFLAKMFGAAVITGINVAVAALNLVSGALEAVAKWIADNKTKAEVLGGVLAVIFAPFIISTGIALAQMVLFNAQMLIYIARANAVKVATLVWAGIQRVLNASLIANPIGLIVTAIGLLIVGIIYAYKHSETFRKIVTGAFDSVKKAATTAFNWVKKNWPLLLAIITGPIGLAVYAIVKNWDKIKAGAEKLKNAIGAAWEWIKTKAIAAWDYIKTQVTNRINQIKATVEGIKQKFQSLWDGIKTAGIGAFDKLKSVINGVIRAINHAIDLVQSLPGVPNVIGHIPELGNNARGTRNWRGGPTWVGETGPEIIDAPKGSRIYSSRESGQMANGSTTINNFNLYGPNSLSEARRTAQWAEDFGSRFGGMGAAAV